MTADNNIYLQSLKIGIDNLEKGISFNQLQSELIRQNIWIKERSFEWYFLYWFFDNFYCIEVQKRKDENKSLDYTLYEQQRITPCFIKGESMMQYIDFIELQEARASSKNARKLAMFAISISIISFIASVLFSCIQIWGK